ncbi:MAG TPA: DUF4169 family protein [Stellaceae bacterium]|nr:DUF4169 family protein [Stellaceae bacterium]
MGSVVNLNRFRKDKQRADERSDAAENRALHGRTKAERAKEAADRKRREDLLEGKKLDPP